MKKNEVREVELTGMTEKGAALGRVDGMAVFVPLGAPGERARVKIVKVEKRFCYGRLEEVLVPSPQRVEPDCPVFAQCGGCCYRHITYGEELRVKERRVADALERIGGFRGLKVEPILGAAGRDGYRNKALLPLGVGPDGKLQMGFYAVNSHRIVDCAACKLHPPAFNRLMEAFRDWAQREGDPVYEETSHTGKMRRLYLRRGENTGELMACVVVNGHGLRREAGLVEALRAAEPGLTTVLVNVNRDKTNVALGKELRTLYGPGFIRDTLCGLTFEISPLSFYQVNPSQAQRLYEKAAQMAAPTGRETILDLYCGTGTIGLSMARRAKEIMGVEVVPQAVENARENARRNGIENARFLCADAAQAAARLACEGVRPDAVILDPPRKGCAPELLKTLAGMSPERVVYVSCDPATLARDLRLLREMGYEPKKVQPVDMFPGTGHVETCILLSKLNTEPHTEAELGMDAMKVVPRQ